MQGLTGVFKTSARLAISFAVIAAVIAFSPLLLTAALVFAARSKAIRRRERTNQCAR